MKLVRVSVFCLFVIYMQSCFFDKKNINVDSFYTTKFFGDIPMIPLVKPLSLSYDRFKKNWSVMTPLSFENDMAIDSIINIGVEKPYVYGKILDQKRNANFYTSEDYTSKGYLYIDQFNNIHHPNFIEKSDNIYRLPIDTINKTFILPKRWFVINVADSTTEAFFSKKKYKKYLKDKGISGKMYNIDSINNVFLETDILPWFPKNVKNKLRH